MKSNTNTTRADMLQDRTMESVVPETFDGALELLDQGYRNATAALEHSEDGKSFAAQQHHGTGRWIRNNWGFNAGEGPLYEWMVEQGLHHPDDMSGLLLTTYWRIKNDEPPEIQQQIDEYKAYWDEKT